MRATFIVRHGQTRLLGEFVAPPGCDYGREQKVIIRTERGTEIGEILCLATERSARFLENPGRGEILREADETDLAPLEELRKRQAEAMTACQELIDTRKLQMNLVDVEAILGGERIIFYYLAEKRVDFRDLVKDLARAFHSRIEMRQVGIRDEAKLLADYGDCGKPVCCNTHLSRMPPVSMRMAKVQKATLDPSKISGRCGRLKCCLRYEYDTYQEHERELPPIGSMVLTDRGQGRVLALELLAKRVVVEFEDRRRIVMTPDEIKGVERPKGRPAKDDDDDRVE